MAQVYCAPATCLLCQACWGFCTLPVCPAIHLSSCLSFFVCFVHHRGPCCILVLCTPHCGHSSFRLGSLPWAGCDHWWEWRGIPGRGTVPFLPQTFIHILQLEEEKAALLGQQQQAEHATTLALEEQERLEQLRLEQEVERQGLEGSLCAAEQVREALEQQLLALRSERSHLQEQLTQVG